MSAIVRDRGGGEVGITTTTEKIGRCWMSDSTEWAAERIGDDALERGAPKVVRRAQS